MQQDEVLGISESEKKNLQLCSPVSLFYRWEKPGPENWRQESKVLEEMVRLGAAASLSTGNSP